MEIDLIKEIVKGGTSAGLLLVVGWFFFSRFFALFDQVQKQAAENGKIFQDQMIAERQAHREENEQLAENLQRLTDGILILAKESQELRRDVRQDDEFGEKELTPLGGMGRDGRKRGG